VIVGSIENHVTLFSELIIAFKPTPTPRRPQGARLAELKRTKAALKQKYSFQQVGVFGDEPVIDLEGIIHFETLLLARAVDWLATLSIDPDLEAHTKGHAFSFLRTQSGLFDPVLSS
jgi:hypothetical protein